MTAARRSCLQSAVRHGDTFIATPSCAKISIPDEGVETLFGSYDRNLRNLESLFDVQIRTDGQQLLVEGAQPGVGAVERVIGQLAALVRDGYELGAGDVQRAARLTAEDQVFVMAFVRSHGSIKEMERAFGVSYPTVKNRLNRIAEQLPLVEVESGPAGGDVLERLERGEIDVDEAIERMGR